MEEERKKGKERKSPQNCKSPMQRQSLVTTIENVTEYTHIHPEAKSKQSNKINYSRLTWQTKETKIYIYQNKTN